MGDDLDIPGQIDSASEFRDQLANHFKPTDCTVTLADGIVSVRMDYEGFNDLESATDRVTDHAEQLYDLPGCDEVSFSVDTKGTYDLETGEADGQPRGDLSAEFTPSPEDGAE